MEREKNYGNTKRTYKQRKIRSICNHNWILAHKERDYFDYCGYRVSVWRCYCAKCGKWKNKKFW